MKHRKVNNDLRTEERGYTQKQPAYDYKKIVN